MLRTRANPSQIFDHQVEGGLFELGSGAAGANTAWAGVDSERIRPQYNRLIVFDPRQKHRVQPIRKGVRYSFQVNLWHHVPLEFRAEDARQMRRAAKASKVKAAPLDSRGHQLADEL